MKNQIFAVIFGLILSFVNVSFAQQGGNYKQQFRKSESVKQPCSNFNISSSADRNYKHSAKANSVSSSEFASIAKCCNKCNDASCCKDNKSCNGKSCCTENNVSSNYKHPYSVAKDNKMIGCKTNCCS